MPRDRDSHTVKIRQRTRLDARCIKMPKVSPMKQYVRNTEEADKWPVLYHELLPTSNHRQLSTNS